ncbi:MAG: ATP-binding protein [Sandaracinaceae bacterium]|jgi:predicted ATPase|nr:ATP-binding protein [Sandaracinaceae bacterium]MBK7150608.1 ATP-binding protein [Sandaracinaceae bacterium]MBK8409255.1 ATP-binding protein [Sandaracinaceae bacterium]
MSAHRIIVLTGGPSAGKTAVQQVASEQFGDRLVLVPEAATLLFSGGFPLPVSDETRRAAQRAIYFVQRELEAACTVHAPDDAVVLCDRGTADGAAYWKGTPDFFEAVGSTREAEHARYHTVIHLAVPGVGGGYNLQNPTRKETPEEARRVDEGITRAWAGHPRLFDVSNETDFVHKLERAMALITAAMEEPG